jgi:hypothetical protein
MWIAKPTQSLALSERAAWGNTLSRFAAMGEEVPLAQTLAWARAIDSVSGTSYLVFDPEEMVGGIVFSIESQPGAAGTFECINGPIIDWDNAANVSRQIATFAMAVSKLSSSFRSLSLKPRWREDKTENRINNLPIEKFSETQAATLKVVIQGNSDQQRCAFSPRLRRTLSISERANIGVSVESPSKINLSSFVPSLSKFALKKGFSVPPIDWFNSLAQNSDDGSSQIFGESLNLSIIRSKFRNHSETLVGEAAILVATLGTTAHYLFGWEERTPQLRSAISLSALAHWQTMQDCIQSNVHTYDLNGYVSEVNEGHPYAGVCRFKEQFGGQVLRYRVPEFRIQ